MSPRHLDRKLTEHCLRWREVFASTILYFLLVKLSLIYKYVDTDDDYGFDCGSNAAAANEDGCKKYDSEDSKNKTSAIYFSSWITVAEMMFQLYNPHKNSGTYHNNKTALSHRNSTCSSFNKHISAVNSCVVPWLDPMSLIRNGYLHLVCFTYVTVFFFRQHADRAEPARSGGGQHQLCHLWRQSYRETLWSL